MCVFFSLNFFLCFFDVLSQKNIFKYFTETKYGEHDGTLTLGNDNVRKVFNWVLHPQAMNELLNLGVSPDLIRSILYMYRHTRA